MTTDPSELMGVRPDPELVVRLLREQAPQLAHLPVQVSSMTGSSNWVFRLGDELAVRLPGMEGYAADLLNEIRWLPHLADRLPVPIPSVVLAGEASPHFGLPWSVVTWLPGDVPTALDGAAQARFARSLGEVLRVLHAVDTDGESPGAERWGYRCGEPVTDTIDEWADQAATALADLFDPGAVREAWRRLRDVPPATAPPSLVHTDLSAENLLVHPDGPLAGVLDFGGVGVGDRSVDFLYAWSMVDAPAREQLRSAAGADDGTWSRARAWAFVGPGLLTLVSYRHTMPDRTARLTTMVQAVAADVGVRLR